MGRIFVFKFFKNKGSLGAAKTDPHTTTANIRRKYRIPTTLRLAPRLIKD
jgi:hypothetical protein